MSDQFKGRVFGVEVTQEDRCLGFWFFAWPGGDFVGTAFLRPSGTVSLGGRCRFHRDAKVWGSDDDKQGFNANSKSGVTRDEALASFERMVNVLAVSLNATEPRWVPVPEGQRFIDVLSAQPEASLRTIPIS